MEFRGVRLPGVLEVPGNRTFNALDLMLAVCMAERKSIEFKEEPVKLVSGRMSNFYVHLRQDVTRDPEYKSLVGDRIARDILRFSIREDGIPHLIGVPYAGIPLAEATAFASWSRESGGDPVMPTSIMRNELKVHGSHNTWVDGGSNGFDGQTPWVIDNTMTDGGSKTKTAERLQQDGFKVKHMPSLVFVDRCQGGMKNLHKLGFTRVYRSYALTDLLFAFEYLGLWTGQTVAVVLKEIAKVAGENPGLPPFEFIDE